MKHSIVTVLIASIFLFSSCEKVINIDLKNAGSHLVIEGSVDVVIRQRLLSATLLCLVQAIIIQKLAVPS